MAKDRARFVVEIDTKSAESALRRLHDAAGGGGPGGGGVPGRAPGGSRIPGGRAGGGGGVAAATKSLKKLAVVAAVAATVLKTFAAQKELLLALKEEGFRKAQRAVGSDEIRTRIQSEASLRDEVSAFAAGAHGQASDKLVEQFARAVAPLHIGKARGRLQGIKVVDELDYPDIIRANQGRFVGR